MARATVGGKRAPIGAPFGRSTLDGSATGGCCRGGSSILGKTRSSSRASLTPDLANKPFRAVSHSLVKPIKARMKSVVGANMAVDKVHHRHLHYMSTMQTFLEKERHHEFRLTKAAAALHRSTLATTLGRTSRDSRTSRQHALCGDEGDGAPPAGLTDEAAATAEESAPYFRLSAVQGEGGGEAAEAEAAGMGWKDPALSA